MATDNQSEPETSKPALLINYNWHHAVNNQSKLNEVLHFVRDDNEGNDGKTNNNNNTIEAIEVDIIYSEVKSQAVMGHPPSIDSDLTLSSFFQQLREVNFQHRYSGNRQTECPVLKLDFKSMTALQSSLADVKSYLTHLPPYLHKRVWINADILSGPGEDLNDELAQKKMQPKFDANEFLNVVTSQLGPLVLSIGWTTASTNVNAVYKNEMVDEMISCAEPYTEVTFPVRGSCFRESWQILQKLYQKDRNWTVTLWWSDVLSTEEFDWIYNTLERDGEFANRTYYDLAGFRSYLSDCHIME